MGLDFILKSTKSLYFFQEKKFIFVFFKKNDNLNNCKTY